jgi:hypothetical protein
VNSLVGRNSTVCSILHSLCSILCSFLTEITSCVAIYADSLLLGVHITSVSQKHCGRRHPLVPSIGEIDRQRPTMHTICRLRTIGHSARWCTRMQLSTLSISESEFQAAPMSRVSNPGKQTGNMTYNVPPRKTTETYQYNAPITRITRPQRE